MPTLMSAQNGKRPVSAGEGSDDPISWLERDHAAHAALCDQLEAIADSLPDDIDPKLCHQVLEALGEELFTHHRDEEDGLFPLLEKRALPGDNVREHLAQLSLEHATDESFANELSEVLSECARGGRPANPNMLGYMLRGFFESYRRHLHWENTVLLPLARERLTGRDLRWLTGKMNEHRQHRALSGRQ